MRSERGKGKPCAYCARIMEAPTSPGWLAATRDHVVPRSKLFGRAAYEANIVLACRKCNQLKANKLPDEWRKFMADNPQWWKQKPERRSRPRVAPPAPVLLPREDSMFILKHGKKAYRAWAAKQVIA